MHIKNSWRNFKMSLVVIGEWWILLGVFYLPGWHYSIMITSMNLLHCPLVFGWVQPTVSLRRLERERKVVVRSQFPWLENYLELVESCKWSCSSSPGLSLHLILSCFLKTTTSFCPLMLPNDDRLIFPSPITILVMSLSFPEMLVIIVGVIPGQRQDLVLT